MRVSKKVKIITLVSIVTVTIVSLACASMNNKTNELSSNQVTKQSILKWQLKAPQLFNNVGFNSLIESNVVEISTVSKYQQQLVGATTNPFGIRDDMLSYILTNIPESNVAAIISAIKMVQFNQQEYYTNNVDELNKIVDKEMAALACLSTYLGGGITGADFIEGYNKVQRNTPMRKNKEEEIENQLGGRVISGNFGFWYTANDSYESICARFIKQGDY